MNLEVVKNIHFSKLVKSSDRLREFNFRKVGGASGGYFHVDVPDDRGNRIIFQMYKNDGQWRIADEYVPNWIAALEDQFSEVIEGEIE
ncbi:hypothetical protein OCK74_14270 [Chitinophagaceae bacterium LB-8]|uniref:Uncharacterized protein n=1 Tax=Paraflavisolibacter caeni TaxID=2982496 RepID=A0A9X3BG44_9BACT|nr:hypothetical protein [Paraflavisolibacter caeni]MCU7550284.1 hypothetical protein [Paraflavisolibacter caeni]